MNNSAAHHRLRNDPTSLKCVEWDVKPCTTNQLPTALKYDTVVH